MALSETVKVKVRFSEVDPIRIVWHGNYIKYMEDAREAFGAKYGLEYMTIFNSGYYAPVYDMHIRYSQGASIGDELLVTIVYRPDKGAKLCFDYEIRRVSDNALVLTGSTIQLFTTREGAFEPSEPEFFHKWKESVKDRI